MSKKSRNGRPTQEGLRLADGEQVYVGCDVHADKYQVALWSPQRQDWVNEWQQPADDQALLTRLDKFRAHVVRVVYEAGPTGFGLARALLAAGFQCEVIAPNLTPKAPTEPDKCDKLDARRLASQAAQGNTLRPVHIPTVQQEQERQVFRVREQQKKRLAQLKQRLKALLLYHAIKAPAGLKHWSLAGIAELRALLVEGAWRWVRGDAYARLLFNQYLAGTALKQKAIVAVARKLAIILWKLLTGPLACYVPGLRHVPPAAVGLKPKPKTRTDRIDPQQGLAC